MVRMLLTGRTVCTRGVDHDLAQGLIGLIEYSYHQGIPSFLKAHL
jgi:hypothetical protein